MPGLSDVTRTSAVRWLTTRELPLVISRLHGILLGTAQSLPKSPGTNTSGTTAPVLDTPFESYPSHIKPCWGLRKSLTWHDRRCQKKTVRKKDPQKKKTPPLSPGKIISRLKCFRSKRLTTGPEKKVVSLIEKRKSGGEAVGVNLFSFSVYLLIYI